MKIALIGYGRMGRAAESIALERGHEIAARIDPVAPEASDVRISRTALCDAEIALEFSLPGAAADNLLRLADLRCPAVCGTTGWLDRLPEISAAFEANGGALLYAANFSIGVNLFYRIAEHAALLFNRFSGYEPYIFEQHHSGKADAPSGTALRLGELLLGNLERKNALALDRLQRRIEPGEISVSAVRAGGHPGQHTLGFDGPHDAVTLTHANRGRESLAAGALLAAEWLPGHQGVFTFDYVLERILNAGR